MEKLDTEFWAGPLKTVAFQVPDVSSSEFIAAAHQQSEAIADNQSELEDQAFIDAISLRLGD